ncbi:putative MFS-type transporter YcaD [Vibrio stylophorae]|uniref:MFS-type transporter YcaD n=1 Tax=Vibrio stylophorae TaxID=659351 RepID=A0ABN8E0E4_9VIBR|nr:MFS transporter [Vibrio stylophorae]CAH0535515.1 putative MFS-type transporter YcaD [Vibrio stylophorae]
MSITKAAGKATIWVPITGLGIFAIASGYLMSLIPLVLDQNQFPAQTAGWMASSYYLGLLLGAVIVEAIIAKIGHRQSMVGFLALTALTVGGMMLWSHPNIWVFLRLVAGIAVAGVFVVIESWLLICDSAKQRTRRLSLYMLVLYGGTALGQLLISALGASGQAPFILIITMLLVSLLPPMLVRGAKPPVTEHQAMRWKDIRALNKAALFGCFISGMLLGPIYGLLPLFLTQQRMNEAQVGVVMTAVVVGGMLVQPIISLFAGRGKKIWQIACCALLGVIAVEGVIMSGSSQMTVISYMMLGMASFAIYPIAISLACDDIRPEQVVSATQICLLGYGVGSVAGPLMAGAMLSMMPYYLLACMVATFASLVMGKNRTLAMPQ